MVTCGLTYCVAGTVGALSTLEEMVGELKRWRKAQITNRYLTWKRGSSLENKTERGAEDMEKGRLCGTEELTAPRAEE